MINNSVSDEDLKMCEKWTMPKLLYTKQSASLQIVAVVWVARSCSLDVNDRKQVLVMQNGLMWLQRALLFCDSKLFWTTGIQTRMDFETSVLKFLYFNMVMLKMAAVSEERNKPVILTFYNRYAEVGNNVEVAKLMTKHQLCRRWLQWLRSETNHFSCTFPPWIRWSWQQCLRRETKLSELHCATVMLKVAAVSVMNDSVRNWSPFCCKQLYV